MDGNDREYRDYLHFSAAYWECVAEDAEGYALEQAKERRHYYLRLIGLLALRDD